MNPDTITTRCPGCGGQTLFIGEGGHLTCSRLDCPLPSVEQALEVLRKKLTDLEGLRSLARVRFHHVLMCVRHGDFTEPEILKTESESVWVLIQ